MGKAKGKKDKIPNRALYSRINYLYQAGSYLASVSTRIPSSQHRGKTTQDRQEDGIHQDERLDKCDIQDIAMKDVSSRNLGNTQNPQPAGTPSADGPPSPKPRNLLPLSRHLITGMRRVALKTQIRLDPSVKRTVCKYCDTVIIPGSESPLEPGPGPALAGQETVGREDQRNRTVLGKGSSSCIGTGKLYVENKSRHGRKPWADLLVSECFTCGRRKRYPLGATRQLRRQLRRQSPPKTKARGEGGTGDLIER